MKKKEIGIIVGLFILVVAGFLVTNLMKQQVNTEDIVVVKLNNEVIFEFDITKDGDYEVQGMISPVYIEVKDEMYHVHDVDCPDHNCEKQGWIRKGDPTPIICLPNQIVIEQQIEK